MEYKKVRLKKPHFFYIIVIIINIIEEIIIIYGNFPNLYLSVLFKIEINIIPIIRKAT